MALIVKDRVRDTTTTTGSGTITLSGTAPIKYRNFASVCANGDTFPYAIVQQGATDEWEVGIGTLVSSTTFTRTVLAGTNGAFPVVFGAGTKDVMIVDAAMTLPFRTITGTASKVVVTSGDGISGNPTIDLGAGVIGAGLNVNASLVETHASSAATFALKTIANADPSSTDAIYIGLQTATAGVPYTKALTAALSLTITSGATLGARNGIPFRLWFVLVDDGGTPRIGVRNCLTTVANAGQGSTVSAISGFPPTGILSSTIMSAASDNAGVTYTDVAVSSQPFSILGYADYDSGLTTAGTWATSPSRIVLFDSNVPLPGADIGNTVNAFLGTQVTGTTITPWDNTIPQSTEGVSMISQAFTPVSIQNVLDVSTVLHGVTGSVSSMRLTAALFIAAGNAVVAGVITPDTTNTNIPSFIALGHMMLAATASAITFTVRVGPNVAGTVRINSDDGGQFYGGVSDSFLKIRELMG